VGSRVLDAGCGRGVFVEALLSYLGGRGGVLPEIVCVEKDGGLRRWRVGGLGAWRGLWSATFCLWGRRSWGPLRLRDQQSAVCVV
jgi:hypothetical protein